MGVAFESIIISRYVKLTIIVDFDAWVYKSSEGFGLAI
jgi:predicted KAP-like P-loop ATPase